MKKIAFCFLIYDVINCEELWNAFFTNVDENKYTIYIHFKYNVPLKYFEKYKINNCIPTDYATTSLVKAQNIVIGNALQDKSNEHFIFLSNSCIPFKNFEYMYTCLDVTKSYFNLMPEESRFPRCNFLLHFVNKQFIQKASQWCILNRKHSIFMIDRQKHLRVYRRIYASDEVFYITNLFSNNLQNELVLTHNASNDATTFTNWSSGNYKYLSNNELKNYSFITKEEIIYLLNSKCLFGRKFLVACLDSFNNETYQNLISTNVVL